VTAAARTVLETYGTIDILVNCAGFNSFMAAEEIKPDTWEKLRSINLDGSWNFCSAVMPAMIQQRSGKIINIGSAAAIKAIPKALPYVVAKHGIVGLTKITALEAAEANITCNAICPGYVYTPLVEAQIEGQAKAHGIPREQVIRNVLLAQQPNKRFVTVEELGALSVFLASDAAASITGTALPVDGGWTAH